jgi:hypothetical protein
MALFGRLAADLGHEACQDRYESQRAMSFNIVPQLEPSKRYSWVLDANGRTDDPWRLSFETRAQARSVHRMR